MIIRSAKFIISNENISKLPPPTMPEVAFIGRSNVGKSSLINMLTQHGKLAKISSKPGKTQTINHFLINDSWYLVDLPGYGYAKASKTNREKWAKFIQNYLEKRENLMNVFVLVDARIPPQEIDIEFINMLGEIQVPLCLVYTKIDKSGQPVAQKNAALMKKELAKRWEILPAFFFTSSETYFGREQVLNYITECNLAFQGA